MMPQPTYSLRSKLDERHVRELHALYQGEWWTRGRSLDDVRRVVEHSGLVFAISDQADDRLLAFARVLTDRVFKALIFDVIVAPDRRAEGLGRRLMDFIVAHPNLESVRHIELYCLPEVVPFYEKWGFSTDVAGVTFMRRKTG
jgi:predicted GNAT family N-acyltransferase